jgi:S-adenosylmethionine synthetase
MIGRFLRSASDYLRVKEEVASIACRTAQANGADDPTVEVNVADDPTSGSFFLTVTRTSAEAGDDGEAGRGNRANGLITPYRPMTMESVAGKNPMTHVGKLYNLAAGLMAEALVEQLPELLSADVFLVSQIGRSVIAPAIVDVRATTREGKCEAACIESIVQQQLPTAVNQTRTTKATAAFGDRPNPDRFGPAAARRPTLRLAFLFMGVDSLARQISYSQRAGPAFELDIVAPYP